MTSTLEYFFDLNNLYIKLNENIYLYNIEDNKIIKNLLLKNSIEIINFFEQQKLEKKFIKINFNSKKILSNTSIILNFNLMKNFFNFLNESNYIILLLYYFNNFNLNPFLYFPLIEFFLLNNLKFKSNLIQLTLLKLKNQFGNQKPFINIFKNI